MDVQDDFYGSVNGFNNAGSGAYGALYTSAKGTVQATYTNNIDMNTGELVAGSDAGSVDTGTVQSIAALSADKAEGQSGSTAFTFTVTRDGNTRIATSASWAVTGSGANPAAGSDFAGAVFPSGTVSFAAGETSKTITVNVAGDTVPRGDRNGGPGSSPAPDRASKASPPCSWQASRSADRRCRISVLISTTRRRRRSIGRSVHRRGRCFSVMAPRKPADEQHQTPVTNTRCQQKPSFRGSRDTRSRLD